MRTLLTLAIATALTACGTTTSTLKIDRAAVRSPTDASSIHILREEPVEPYVTIAMVEVSDRGFDLGPDALKIAIAREAAKVGGDAVIVGPETRKHAGFSLYGDMYLSIGSPQTLLAGKVISLAATRPAQAQ